MGFLHQLHLLLWKNISLKRRGPVSINIYLFERKEDSLVWLLCLPLWKQTRRRFSPVPGAAATAAAAA